MKGRNYGGNKTLVNLDRLVLNIIINMHKLTGRMRSIAALDHSKDSLRKLSAKKVFLFQSCLN